MSRKQRREAKRNDIKKSIDEAKSLIKKITGTEDIYFPDYIRHTNPGYLIAMWTALNDGWAHQKNLTREQRHALIAMEVKTLQDRLVELDRILENDKNGH